MIKKIKKPDFNKLVKFFLLTLFLIVFFIFLKNFILYFSYVTRLNKSGMEIKKGEILQKKSVQTLHDIIIFNTELYRQRESLNYESLINPVVEKINGIEGLKMISYSYKDENSLLFFDFQCEVEKKSMDALFYLLESMYPVKLISAAMYNKETVLFKGKFLFPLIQQGYYTLLTRNSEYLKMQAKDGTGVNYPDYTIDSISGVFSEYLTEKKNTIPKSDRPIPKQKPESKPVVYDYKTFVFTGTMKNGEIIIYLAKSQIDGKIIMIYPEDVIRRDDDFIFFLYDGLYYAIKVK